MKTREAIPVTTVSGAACCGDDCCSDTATTTSAEMLASDDPAAVRAMVREKYGALAAGEACGCGCGCAPADAAAVLGEIGYSADQAAAIPDGANLGLGCGNPVEQAALRAGETVLDLGSGAGIDCFLAGREVGPSGHVIGVDMTAPMLERARGNVARAGATNVEFRLGEIEHLPVADATIDCVISNCVINLSPDKPQVLREAFRALRPGGRMVVSDLVLTRELAPEMRRNVALYVGCVAGASLEHDYLGMIRGAGFERIEVLSRTGYSVGGESLAADGPERQAFESVVSLKVRAHRPAA